MVVLNLFRKQVDAKVSRLVQGYSASLVNMNACFRFLNRAEGCSVFFLCRRVVVQIVNWKMLAKKMMAQLTRTFFSSSRGCWAKVEVCWQVSGRLFTKVSESVLSRFMDCVVFRMCRKSEWWANQSRFIVVKESKYVRKCGLYTFSVVIRLFWNFFFTFLAFGTLFLLGI